MAIINTVAPESLDRQWSVNRTDSPLSTSTSSLPSSSSSSSKVEEPTTTTVDAATKQDLLASYILSQLTTKEIEIAARAASYEYLIASSSNIILFEETKKYAKQYIERYLNSKTSSSKKKPINVEDVLQKITSTLHFRREMDVEKLITACTTTQGGEYYYANRLQKQFSSKHMFVQGYDKDGRSTFIFRPKYVQHNNQDSNKEWTIKEAVYTMERAIACTKTRDKTINAIVDMNGFNPIKHSPPFEIGKEFMVTLRNHYAGYIHKIYIINAPSSFTWVWSMFQTFVGSDTRGKIHFLHNTTTTKKKDHGIEQQLESNYEKDEIPSWLLESSSSSSKKKKKNDGCDCNNDIDIERYLYEIPFDQAYGGR